MALFSVAKVKCRTEAAHQFSGPESFALVGVGIFYFSVCVVCVFSVIQITHTCVLCIHNKNTGMCEYTICSGNESLRKYTTMIYSTDCCVSSLIPCNIPVSTPSPMEERKL